MLGAFHLNAKKLSSCDCGIGIFPPTISINRFHFLLTCLRFDELNSRAERNKTDRLMPIQEILETNVQNYRKHFYVSEKYTVDEKLKFFLGIYFSYSL